MKARGTEEERVYVAQRVARVEALVVHDGRRDDLLSQAKVLAAKTLDKVSEEDVDFVKVFWRLYCGQVALAPKLDLLFVEEPFLVVTRLPEVSRHFEAETNG